MLCITEVYEGSALEAVKVLLRQYAKARDFDAALKNFDRELAQLPGKYAAPTGALLLATYDGVAAACVALQALKDGVCEMKRLYVLPNFRRKGIAKALSIQLLQIAKDIGYTTMKLDTHPNMLAAHHLYKSLGFKATARYNENPIEGILFFERIL
ncbi:MAG: GNAT family N-acetyltransferase [Bacteroidota bacterium]